MVLVKQSQVFTNNTTTQVKKYRIKDITYPKNSTFYLVSKRILDILGSLFGLIIFSPIFLITAICIKLDDGGPVIHTQTRVGKHGKFFRFHKFRSMSEGERGQVKFNVYDMDSNIPILKSKNNNRITKVGKFIRKTSIDELPQLWDVFVGNMSLVGPRPALAFEVYHYNNYQMQSLCVKQGLTCNWQCYGRMSLSYTDRIKMDINYIKKRNLFTDVKLILCTIPSVISSKGAW